MRSYLAPALLWLATVGAVPLEQRDFPDLRAVLTTGQSSSWSPDTIISFPGTEEFENATARWTIAGAPTYAAAISPATEADVALVVKLATTFNIPFLATGKRHGFTHTWEELEEGLAIDLSLLGSYEIDAETGLITIGGSSGMGDFQEDLDAAGWMIQGGSGLCPGYLGLALGGGVGRYMGLFGLVHDAWVSARVVVASGEIVTVSDDENQDLWWAMRGAGANFGVVTSATFQARKKSEYSDGFVLNADLYFPPEKTAEYFNYLASLDGQLPRNVAILHISSYNATTGQAQMLANWVWIGPEDEGREYLQQFIDIGPTEVRDYKYITWSKLIHTSIGGFGAGLCDNKQYRDFYTVNTKRYDAAIWQHAFETLSQWFEDQPEARNSFMNLEVFPNQATAEYGHDHTAYPWRDTTTYIQIGIHPDDPYAYGIRDAGKQMAQELRASWFETSGFEGDAIYVNYARGDEPIESIYGRDKLPRLAALKRQWDPKNAFGFNNALPLHYGNCTAKH